MPKITEDYVRGMIDARMQARDNAEARRNFINDKLAGVPAEYHTALPETDDRVELSTACNAIRDKYTGDIAAKEKAAHEPDLSKMNPMQLMEYGMRQNRLAREGNPASPPDAQSADQQTQSAMGSGDPYAGLSDMQLMELGMKQNRR